MTLPAGPRSSFSRRVSRRGLLASALGAGLLAALPGVVGGCAEDPLPPRRAPRTLAKTLHLAFRGPKAERLARAKRVEIHVGARRYEATPHTGVTRDVHAARLAGAGLASSYVATHFAASVSFSAEAPQSYAAYATFDDGPPVLFGAGIHVPRADERARLASGLAPDVEPTDVLDDDDAAVWSVFHDPNVMALDLDTAEAVVAVIRSRPDFASLRDAIAAFPEARDPSAAAYAGWVYGRYRTYRNAAGEDVALTQIDLAGRDILGVDGRPLRVVDWDLSPYTFPDVPTSVRELARRVTEQTLRAFHDDPGSFEGVKYTKPAGVGSRADGPLAGQLGAEAEPFTFSADGTTVEHRKLGVEPVADRKGRFEVKLDNYLALGALYGVSHFGAEGNHLKTNVLGYAPSTFYPSFTAAAKWHTTGEATFDRPDEAVTSNVWTCAPAMHHGDYGPHGDQVAFTGRAFIPWTLSIFADIVLPGVFLSLGLVGCAEARHDLLIRVLGRVVIEDGWDALVEVVLAAVNLTYGSVAGQNVGHLLVEMGVDLVKILVHTAEKLFLQGAFAVAVGEILAGAGATTALTAAVPFVGWAVIGAEILLTGSQLAVSTAHLVGSTIFTHGVVAYTHPVTLRVAAEGSAYFPSSARHYAASVGPARGAAGAGGAFTPLVVEAPVTIAVDERGREYFEVELESVPVVAPLRIEVVLRDGPPGTPSNVVGRGVAADVPNVKVAGQGQEVEIEVEIVPVTIDGTSRLVHDVVLRPVAGVWTWSAKDAPAPVADADPFRCRQGALCDALGLSVRHTEDAPGRVAFSYRTVRGTTTPIAAAVDMARSVADVPEAKPLVATRPVDGGTRLFVQGLGGERVLVVQPARERARVYVLPEGEGETDLAAFDDAAEPYFVSRGGTVVAARVTPDGQRLLLASSGGLELVPLGHESVPRAARASTTLVRPGSAVACLDVVSAAAGFPRAAQVAVLDTGRARVSVFDYAGGFVRWFDTPDGDLRLDLAAGAQSLVDVDVDTAGNVWVLGLRPERTGGVTPVLAVHARSGARRATFEGLAAERFALDRFTQVFTLNRELVADPAGYAAPSVSRWVLRTPAVAR